MKAHINQQAARPLALLYGLPESTETGRGVRAALEEQGFSSKEIAPEQLLQPVDPADYPGAAPEGFRWEAAVSREDGRAVFTGWACVEGEPFPDVDIRVVLYHAEDGAYYSIPTQMTPDEAATAAVADGRGYALGGFTAVVPEKVLAHPLAEYEICIAYRVGGFDFLASTGKTAEVTG